ncbi:MAG: exosortase/archaeosortase family protein [Candidatus Margulisbacteria bacterium]|nr:exosortase/archaeosortase family protein [Candidatus Margulisiibacteriota bacterium]
MKFKFSDYLDILKKHYVEILCFIFILFIFRDQLLVSYNRILNEGASAYSYLAFIPIISIYLVWQKKDLLLNSKTQPLSWALLPLLLIFVLVLFTNKSAYFINNVLFTACMLFYILLFYGWNTLYILFFPLFFYVLNLSYISIFSYLGISILIRNLSSKLAAFLLFLIDQNPLLKGNIITLGKYSATITPACSGLNNLYAFLIIGILFVYFTKLNIWKKWFLYFCSFPIAIISNSLRIFFLIILSKYFGAFFEAGFGHYTVGGIIFFVSLGLFPLLEKLLQNEPKK